MFRLLIKSYSFLLIIVRIRVCLPQIVRYSDEVNEPAFVPRVVNGRPAKLGDVPYQLAFKALKSRYTRTYSTFCGGSIIGPNKVLSAAHCFDEKKSECSKFFGGDSRKVSDRIIRRALAVAGNLYNTAKYNRKDNMETGQWRKLKSMYIPTGYKFPRNDICVGFTKLPFVFNSHIASIPYATRYQDYKMNCLVSGYGRQSKKVSSEILQLANLEVFSNSLCSRVHRRNMRKFICTSSVVSDVQKGDSGGPLVCKGTRDPAESSHGVIVGVVSGNRYRAGSFFTRVSSFSRFVQKGKGCDIRGNIMLLIIVFIIRWSSAILILFYS